MTERPLADAIRPRLDEARLARQWDAIRAGVRVPSPRRRRQWVWAAALAPAVLALVVWINDWAEPVRAPQSSWDGAIVESQTEPVTVRLKDGSRIDLQERSRLEVVERREKAVQLQLRKGKASFDVTKDPQRSFSVVVEDVTVRVIGTSFSVAIEPETGARRVSVAVERGVVQAGDGKSQVVLHAGQHWSKLIEEPREEPAVPKAAPPSPVAETAVPPRGSRPIDAPPASAPAPAPPPGAKELFEEANSARRAGDFGSAAEHYRALLQRYPTDARAGLAAFELGRLLQDRFGDSAGAARALNQAIRASVGAGFREDAMARLVRAYATMGASKQCEQARSAYLRSYPGGVHTTAVERACGGGEDSTVDGR